VSIIVIIILLHTEKKAGSKQVGSKTEAKFRTFCPPHLKIWKELSEMCE